MSTISYPELIERFVDFYYHLGHNKQGTWDRTWWMGVKTEKAPTDMWIYQELLYRIRPQLIIETGTRHGGSALFLAHMCDLLGTGEVVTVDIVTPENPPRHPRITYLTGSSTSPEIADEVRRRAAGKSPVFVILDSDHSMKHVLDEIHIYGPLVTPGSYMIVEDTNVNGHPVWREHGPGPFEALQQFFSQEQEFEIDRECERHLLTMHPFGFLRKRMGTGGTPTPTRVT